FLASLVFNIILGIVTFVLFGGRRLIGVRDAGDGTLTHDGGAGRSDGGGGASGRRGTTRAGGTYTGTTAARQTSGPGQGAASVSTEPSATEVSLNPLRVLTLAGIALVAVGAFFELDPGF